MVAASPTGPGAPGHGRDAPAGHGRDRRRAVRGHRGVPGPGRAGPRGGRPGRPRPRPGGRAGPAPRAWWPATCPSWLDLAVGDPAGPTPDRGGPGVAAEARTRPAWAEIDLGAVPTTPPLLCQLAAPAALCAVVKADGYGHGAVAVARAALEAGRASLAVALVDEGLELRRAGIGAPGALLSEPPPGPGRRGVAAGLTPTLYTPEGVAAGPPPAAPAGRGPLAVHVKVDTGMHRVGADPAELLGPGGRRPGRARRSGSRGCGPIWPWPTARLDEDRQFTAAPAGPVHAP